MEFKAVMFDFDGTITIPGHYEPPQKMVDALVMAAKKAPISCCTGRQLESFEEHGLKALIEDIAPSELEIFLENLHLIAENGAVGYFFNTDLDKFEEFYSVEWPSNFVERKVLMDTLNEAIKEYGVVYYKKHKIVVVMRTNHHTSGDIGLMNELSNKIYNIAKGVLREISEDYEEYVHIGNSGIGVVIGPANGDKDRGVEEFAKYLEKKGMVFSEDAKEILVLGDQPQKGGNDHYFLNGRLGTPYCVGEIPTGFNFPKPVINDSGETLRHVDGTIFMLEKHFS